MPAVESIMHLLAMRLLESFGKNGISSVSHIRYEMWTTVGHLAKICNSGEFINRHTMTYFLCLHAL